ncbi:sigma-54-dependent transcriptional regulator [Chondromyces apiculatus]|uniref:Transcriptional regulator BkdR of isoleucine and valine catabolism operon n=1 Tax=Chondromyces apiculatus DSM 436 TaxID=1192034 RepID=A0A017T3B6_9BACT|nr:sigma-54 dependent transcriptional regulator [Chondromyces apiculatus]EYF03477.1 Transcriptional regulator BkdR of isoleucine and valine catabolism operon [Chondromyces apiculatus DSM 436]
MLPEKKQILVVDDEANLRRVLAAQLSRDGYEVHTAEDGEAGLAFLKEHHIDLVLTDLRMPKVDGMDLLRASLRDDPSRPVVMITAYGTVDNAVEALKTGAFDYITKPADQDEVRMVVKKALRTRDLERADATRDTRDLSTLATRPELTRFGIIGESQAIQDLYAILERVADTPTTVLIAGESGTGKELVARALHDNSSRRERPFIKVNCAAIPKDLMESELFGYERGAFTGAVGSKPGRFELASGGTLFLDEIGEIPNEMQVKLLRVLQESEFERVGGIKTIRVDVRLVAATNRDLKREIAAGTFREDLFYRLNVVPITLPALRERKSDIPHLAAHFIAKFNARLKKNVEGIEGETLERLTSYEWPGNIRELENVIERAVLFADGARLRVEDLPEDVRIGRPQAAVSAALSPAGAAQDAGSQGNGPDSGSGAAAGGSPDKRGTEGLKEQVKAAMSKLERDLIERALQQTGGNVTHAARLLKISRKGLQLKMKELNLRERDPD